jgi:hypothetical protein
MPAVDPLAHAFLALADDDEPPARRSPLRAAAALLSALVLAIGVPLALQADHPVTALGAKAGAALADE